MSSFHVVTLWESEGELYWSQRGHRYVWDSSSRFYGDIFYLTLFVSLRDFLRSVCRTVPSITASTQQQQQGKRGECSCCSSAQSPAVRWAHEGWENSLMVPVWAGFVSLTRKHLRFDGNCCIMLHKWVSGSSQPSECLFGCRCDCQAHEMLHWNGSSKCFAKLTAEFRLKQHRGKDT